MPVLLESCICFLEDFAEFKFQNFEYCKCFPKISETPRPAIATRLTTDMTGTIIEGGVGKIINLDNMDAIANLL
jgi:hypothetical protein